MESIDYIAICNEIGKSFKEKTCFNEKFKYYGLEASLIYIENKLQEVKFVKENPEQKAIDSSVEDILLDIANYAIMGVYASRKKGGKNNGNS